MRPHIDLSEPCVLKPGHVWRHDGLAKPGFHRCHCCENDTTKELICTNPKHWFYGTPRENSMMRSLENRQAGGRTHKGRVQSAEQVANRAASLTGKTRTPEQKAKMSAAHKGKPWSEARRKAYENSRRQK